MGGGAVWRGVARVVSPAVRVGSASTSTSCSFCQKVSTSAQASKAHSGRLRSCACSSPGTGQKTSVGVSQQGAALWEPDEWEFAEEEERVDHLVFGSLPSRTEIEEASSELQSALRLGLVAQGASDQAALAQASRAFSPAMIGGQSGESSTNGVKEVLLVSNPTVKATQMALDWVEPPPIRSGQGILQCGRRDNVVDAFCQFQHNPEVQSMVKSLATDPAIWDAVLANEKIQEFKRKLQKDKAVSSEGEDCIFANVKSAGVKGEVKIEEVQETGEYAPNIFSRWQSFWQRKISLFMDVLSHIIDGIFKGADRKVFAEEDGDIIDRTVKSCTMLALVVLCVVILKRLAVQAA